MMSGVTFTKHAKQRMEQRQIGIPDIVRTLALGEAIPTRRPAVYERKSRGALLQRMSKPTVWAASSWCTSRVTTAPQS
jgi:hypothetical protein